MEDVGALGVLLDLRDFPVTGSRVGKEKGHGMEKEKVEVEIEEELSKRLKVYEKMRLERLPVIMRLSALPLGAEREIREMLPGHAIHRTGIRSGEEHLGFLYE